MKLVVSVGLCGLALVSIQGCSGADSQSHTGGAGSSYVVAMLQSPVAQAADLTTTDIAANCDPKKVPHLTKLEADGRGTTDATRITVVGAKPSDVAKPFASRQTEICPGN